MRFKRFLARVIASAVVLALVCAPAFAGGAGGEGEALDIRVTGGGKACAFDAEALRLVLPDCAITAVYAWDTEWYPDNAREADFQALFGLVQAAEVVMPKSGSGAPFEAYDSEYDAANDTYNRLDYASLEIWIKDISNESLTARITLTPYNYVDFPLDGHLIDFQLLGWKDGKRVSGATMNYRLKSEELWTWVVSVAGGGDFDIARLETAVGADAYSPGEYTEPKTRITDANAIARLAECVANGEYMGEHIYNLHAEFALRFTLGDGERVNAYITFGQEYPEGSERFLDWNGKFTQQEYDEWLASVEKTAYARVNRAFYKLDFEEAAAALALAGIEYDFPF